MHLRVTQAQETARLSKENSGRLGIKNIIHPRTGNKQFFEVVLI